MPENDLQLDHAVPKIVITESLAAYLLGVLLIDMQRWDGRRRITQEEVAAFADAIAERLPPELRGRVEAWCRRALAA